jgi:cobalt-zinc-cadmium efflux system membrane fusion protein
MKTPKRRNFTLAGLAILAAAAWTGCGQKPIAHPEPPPPKVEGDAVTFPASAPQLAAISVETAAPRQMALTHLTGRLYWNDDLTVRIFTPVAGRVLDVRADLGDPITVGTPLAEIDSPDFAQARADARTAAGNLAAAQKTYDRTRELLDHGAAAQKDVDAAEAAWIAARAEHDRAQERLANYGGSENSANSVYLLRSPLAGALVDKNINPGQEVRADQMLANAPNLTAPLFVVSDPSQLWLQVDVPETGLATLAAGQLLRISSPAYPDRVFDGRISRISATLDPATRTVRVRGVVENPEALLKAEMYVAVDVIGNSAPSAQAVEIPAKATFMRNNQYYLFVEESPAHFVRRRVTLGTEQDGKVPVFLGVSPGQKVVTEGCLLLQALIEPAS